MAACTELEIEEKSSEESSCNAVRSKDVAFQEVNLKSRCYAAYTAKSQGELKTQLKVECETSSKVNSSKVNELSDDEFEHLLKEASTFNKPNDQESILLKQLRKEVADADSCEQVRCSETSCVTKRTDRNSSKLPCGKSQNSIDVNRIIVNTHNFSNTNTSSLSSRTFKSFHENDKESNESESQMYLSSKDGVTVIEVNPPSQWPTKARKTSVDTQSVLEPHKTVCNSNKFSEEDMSPGVSIETNCESKPTDNSCDESFNNAKSQLGGLPVEFKLEVDPLPTLLIGNYQNFAREIRVPGNNSPVSQQNSNESPSIELTEFKRTKDNEVRNADQKNSDPSTSKSQINNQLSTSKFYVNCNDVDTTVTFPLKLVSTMDERNGGGIVYDAMNEQMKHRMSFPYFPWPRPQQVHSFLNSAEDSQSQNESENNSNPFTRGARTANITSFVSATLLDYPNTALIPDTQSTKLEWTHRKHKRTRNHTESNTFILSENIEGHRGNEDIDSLVKFIEAADKNNKAFHRGNITNNHLLSNKTNSTQESLKKKVNGKEAKNQNKNYCLSRKKLSQSNSEESYKQDSLDNKNANSESECSDDSSCNKKKVNVKCSENTPLLDINSNIMDMDHTFILTSETSNSVPVDSGIENSSSARSVSPDGSGFPNDFYSISESVPSTTEDSGFCIVRKKQRKKHQMKRSENYRWHSAAARVRQSTSGEHDYYSKDESEHGSNMMLLPGSLQRGQCGKQDSRRKSTSSVPQSEQSSADNSDLDSVHSLPVRGSAPHPTQPHPHTTPSSSSSTPQASYADIARMPISSMSRLNSSATGNGVTKPNNFVDKSCVTSHNAEKEMDSTSTKPNVTNTETCIFSNRSTREINTQTEPLTESDSEKMDSSFEENKVCGICNISIKTKMCTCSKLQKHINRKDTSECAQRPAVVMMGSVPSSEASDISFGIDLAEILQISSTDSNCSESIAARASVNCFDSLDYDLPCGLHHSNGCNCRVSDATKSSFDSGNLCKIDINKRISVTFHKKMSSPCNELLLSSGQKLLYSDREINIRKFNYTQLVDHFTREWKTVQSEYSSDNNKSERRVRYYDEDYC